MGRLRQGHLVGAGRVIPPHPPLFPLRLKSPGHTSVPPMCGPAMGLGLGRAEDNEDARSVVAIRDARSVRSSEEDDDEEDGGLGG